MEEVAGPVTPLRTRWQTAAPWLAAVLTGLLLVACFPPFDQGWLAWIAFTPLLAALWWRDPAMDITSAEQEARRSADSVESRFRRGLRRVRGARPFWLGYIAGFVFWAGAFHWLAALGVLFSSPVLYALPVLLAGYMGIYFAIWCWFLDRQRPLLAAARFGSSWRNLLLGVVAACAFVALEWFRSWFLTGFGWNTMAVAIRRDLPIIQVAEFTGAYGLTWLVVFVNVMTVIIGRRLVAELGPNFLKPIRWEFSVTMAVVAGVFAFGARTLLARPSPTVTLRAAAVQPNIPQEVKFAGPEEEDRILAIYRQQNAVAAAIQPPPQLIVWPESSTPRGVFADEVNQRFVEQEASRGAYGLLLGSLEGDFDPDNSENMLIYNSAVLLTEHGARTQIFRKMHLVIFGEYLPFREYMPAAIAALIPGDLAAGHDFTVLDLPEPKVKVGALVCFEDTVPEVAAGLVRGGAELLVNLTNDGWFLRSAQPDQHLANAVLRTVEFRRPLLRGTNSGVTCEIDAYGRVKPLAKALVSTRPLPNSSEPSKFLQPFEEGVGICDLHLPLKPRLTFYAQHGDWFAHLSALCAGAAVLRASLRRRRARLHY